MTKTKELTFEIQGMTCVACSARIETILNKMNGINEATINLTSKTGLIRFDEELLSQDDIIKKIQTIGFDANVREDDAAPIDHNAIEIKKRTITLFISIIFSIPLLWTKVTHLSFTNSLYVPEIFMNSYVQWALASVVQFGIGWQFYKGAYYSLRNKSANMDLLVALGTSATYFYSAYSVIKNWKHPKDLHLALYFETSVVLIILILLGKLFEVRSNRQSSSAITQGSKPPIQRLADKISSIFVPVAVAIAAITFIITYFFIEPGNLAITLERTIAVLVIACPCAFGLATPTSIIAGSGRAAKAGILFKTVEALEQAKNIQTVVFNKTGTITNGTPTVTNFFVKSTVERQEIIKLVASAERLSEHPIGMALVNFSQDITLVTPSSFKSLIGLGIIATVNNEEILIGSHNLLTKYKIDLHEEISVNELENQGKTVLFVAKNQEHVATIAVSDSIKEHSSEAIQALNNLGIETIMLSSDQRATASAIAKQVGIKKVFANVTPQQKSEVIKKLQATGKLVAMVGDGINDAPALATANIGIGMCTGSAIEAVDITVASGDLGRVVAVLEISSATVRNMKQNLFWSLGYNTIGIPIAAIGLLAPWVAGVAMAFSSVSVVLNALRLQKYSFKHIK